MRLLSVATVTVVTALVLTTAASAGLWLDLDRVTATPGETVHGKAVSPCSACGPGPLFLVPTSNAALQLLKRVPRGDPRFVPVGQFTWKRGGTFAFEVPQVRPGLYQLMALYRNGPAWTAAPASTLLRIQASLRVSFDVFSIVLPRDWYWRTLKGAEPRSPIVQVSNSTFHTRRGLDPIKNMSRETFVLSLVPLGAYGSHTSPTIDTPDFLPRSDPSRPRGHALARHSYCSSGGRCFSIAFVYGSERVPGSVLASVNRALRSLRASPLRG